MPVFLAAAGALIEQSAKPVIKLKKDQPTRLMFFTLEGERRERKRFVTLNPHFAHAFPMLGQYDTSIKPMYRRRMIGPAS